MGATTAGLVGLRERKKARTRDALIDAGMRLFTERGFTATTTEEIAAHADVSQRTFFRYFTSKEDVALAVHAGFDTLFYRAVLARPHSEAPYTALRNAAHDSWGRLDRDELEARASLLRLFDRCPQLRAAHLRHCFDQQQRLVDELTRRRGPDAALRVHLAVAAFFSASQTAYLVWNRSPKSRPEDLAATLLRCVDDLVPALTGP